MEDGSGEMEDRREKEQIGKVDYCNISPFDTKYSKLPFSNFHLPVITTNKISYEF